ncbi:MAG: DUF4249 domain-containing protein [Saprospiraceae bacterium]|nr:DUF4249 domain-containing protein [Saprospiraceae bacterium]
MKLHKIELWYGILVFGVLATLWTSCTDEFIPDTQESDQQYVVEGFIEAGDSEMPTFVLLTKSIPFLSTIDLTTFNDIFVNNAKVTVFDGAETVELQEFCLDDLPPEVRDAAAIALGFDPDSTTLNICAYVDLLDVIDRKEGGVYDLKIEVEGEEITATTTIPEFVPLFNLRWDDPPGEPSDTVARLWVTIDDPANEANFYRYFTEENDNGFVSPFSSVVDDAFFDGKEFEFPLTKAEPRDGDFDAENFGFYFRGDSIRIKWMTLDAAHFEFWNTLEFSRNNAGPFSSYNRVTSNVNGALGVWGGYAVGFYDEFVPVK